MDFDNYQTRARLSAVYPGHMVVVYPALGLCGESGEVAEIVKKCIRDNNGKISPEQKAKLIAELGDVLWYLANIAMDLDVSLATIAEHNLAKLSGRQARGTLHGSGDNR
jgi:NTP pyrophosphatase (non-canonical NTP hydrolase)